MFETPFLYYWIIPLIAWSALWKITALWKAARNRQLAWFIALAFLNTTGMLPILYIYFYQKNQNQKNS